MDTTFGNTGSGSWGLTVVMQDAALCAERLSDPIYLPPSSGVKLLKRYD